MSWTGCKVFLVGFYGLDKIGLVELECLERN